MKRDREESLRREDTVVCALRSLPRLRPPSGLNSSLRVLASREVQRRMNSLSRMDRLRLSFDNMMRPLALPFAGGLFSAVILFSMWVPGYPVHASNALDVPLGISTDASVKRMAPIATNAGEDVVVDVRIDGDGRMIDYSIVTGDVSNDAALRRSIEGFLLLTSFTPATAFGQPVAGKLRLTLRSSHIDVRG
jgi:hypothetical protein